MSRRYLEDTGKGNRVLEWLGTGGLFLFAFSALLSTSGASIGLGCLLVSSLLYRPVWPKFIGDPVLILCVICATFLALRTGWAVWEFPESRELQESQAWDWFRLLLFICVAWWSQRDLRKRAAWLLLLSLAGLLIGMVYHLSSHPGLLWSGKRTGFHLPIIAFGLYSSTAILGLLTMAPRIWGKRENRPFYPARVGLWLVGLVLLTHGLIITGSRGAWIAAILVIPPMVFLRYHAAWKRRASSRWRSIGLVSVTMALFGLLILANLPQIQKRVVLERQTFKATWKRNFDQVPTHGFGVRVQTFRFGLAKWIERPIFGWGPGATEYLISHSGLPSLQHPLSEGRYAWLDHLHNLYLEVLVRFGLAGTMLLLTVVTFLLKALWHAHREGRLPADYAFFLTGTFALVVLWSLSDFRLLHPDWRSYWILLGGITYALGSPPRDDAKLKARANP
jgi:O-antigen ligase